MDGVKQQMTCDGLWDKNQKAGDELEQPSSCPAGFGLVRFSGSLDKCVRLLAQARRPSGEEQMLHPHAEYSPRVCVSALTVKLFVFSHALCQPISHLAFDPNE